MVWRGLHRSKGDGNRQVHLVQVGDVVHEGTWGQAEVQTDLCREPNPIHPLHNTEPGRRIGAQLRLAEEVTGRPRLPQALGVESDSLFTDPQQRAPAVHQRANRRVGYRGPWSEHQDRERCAGNGNSPRLIVDGDCLCRPVRSWPAERTDSSSCRVPLAECAGRASSGFPYTICPPHGE